MPDTAMQPPIGAPWVRRQSFRNVASASSLGAVRPRRCVGPTRARYVTPAVPQWQWSEPLDKSGRRVQFPPPPLVLPKSLVARQFTITKDTGPFPAASFHLK